MSPSLHLFDHLPEGSPVRHNLVRNVRPNLAPVDHPAHKATQARCFTLHLDLHSFLAFHSQIWLDCISIDDLHAAANPVPLGVWPDRDLWLVWVRRHSWPKNLCHNLAKDDLVIIVMMMIMIYRVFFYTGPPLKS